MYRRFIKWLKFKETMRFYLYDLIEMGIFSYTPSVFIYFQVGICLTFFCVSPLEYPDKINGGFYVSSNSSQPSLVLRS